MELMQAIEHYATAMRLADRYGNKYGDVDSANNAWHECRKAAEKIEVLQRELTRTQSALTLISEGLSMQHNAEITGGAL